MKHPSSVLALLFVASMIVACSSSDGGGGGGTSASPEAAATNSVDGALGLQSLGATPDNGDALAKVTRLYGDLQSMALAKQVEQAKRTGALEYDTVYGAAQLGAACRIQNGTTITYTNCTVQGVTFAGTITVDGNDVTFDLTIDADPSTFTGAMPAGATGQGGTSVKINSVTVREVGNLTVSATKITGTVNVDVTADMDITLPEVPGAPAGVGGGTQNVKQTSSLKATFDVDLDSTPCAVGGTLTVEQTQPTSVTTTATFGPGCGDVTL